MITVVLDPDGTRDVGLTALILAPTGVTYSSQVGGFATQQRFAEGYLVPIGCQEDAMPFVRLFAEAFGGNPPPSGLDWGDRWLGELESLVQSASLWSAREGWKPLKLDRERLAELTEGWIPVQSSLGPGLLLFKNSD
jgi:Family of unknown function (DUF6210)